MLFRLIFWLIIFYLVYRLIKNWLTQPPPKQQVKGRPKTRPLDLSDADIEDAKFREVEDEPRSKQQ